MSWLLYRIKNFLTQFNSSFDNFFWFLHVQDAVEDNVSELDSPLHGEVRPVQVGGEEDEADPIFRVPVEHGAANSHEAVPAFYVLTGGLNIIRIWHYFLFASYSSLKAFSPPWVM